ncbi:hypothetical protein SAMN05518849_12416 [Sphingobium sp. AP50]|uniref:hypothetical protein n=1 Tax=Sphingobium sp. AP50 TaxID=1884369 RepID=UPI0008D78D4D|nr:hypothetical protein [Sphingobium sp. AP50]SEJ99464.1 hypothetical protein SAMN05518849_12416 [Sphingobium sp. AP50]
MSTCSDIVADPHFMPVGITPDLCRIRFAKVRPEIIRTHPFLDGRSHFTEGNEILLPVDDVAAELASRADIRTSTILHVSFCGSTLLSRLLDIPGQSLGLREPAVQICLADAVTAHPGKVCEVASVIDALLGRTIEGQQTIVKPTNWANNLLPTWNERNSINPIFMVMAPRPFLRAAFRGGRDRLTYTMRTAQHLAPGLKDGFRRLAKATGSTTDPLQQAARLTLLALSFQLLMFEEARNKGGWSAERVVAFDELHDDPVGIAARTSRLLNLDISPAIIARHSETILARNAKLPDRQFRADEEAENNRVIEQHHGRTFDKALEWAYAEGLYLIIDG